MKKILAVCYSHESNTFTPLTTKLSDYVIREDEAMLPLIKEPVKVLEEAGYQVVPSIYASTGPSGTNEREVYDYVEKKVAEVIDANPDIVGVWAHLHGANFVKEVGHAELALLKMIRGKLGPNVPISWAMDPHGNVSPEHIPNVDIIRAYRRVPHVDVEQTQVEAAKALVKRLEMGNHVAPVYVRVPVLVGGEQSVDSQEPMISIFKKLWELDKRDGILMSSYTVGFVWGDTPYATAAVEITPMTEADRPMCEEEAKKLRDYVVEHRHEFQFAVTALEPDDTVKRAIEAAEKPVYISDSGDNPTAGATGCNTIMLDKFLKADLKGKKLLIASILDAPLCERLLKMNIGDAVKDEIGTCVDADSYKVPFEGVLKGFGELFDGRTGQKLADTATVAIGGIDLVVESYPHSFTSMKDFETAGVNPDDYDIVMVKQGYLFPELDVKAKFPIMCLSPGTTYQIVARLPFKIIQRPTYPMDEL
ncbi:M81 family metallopeptidase [Gehongia tenuis]|uniref:M81 family metallopeptidase n=1 Tax=Gehongia tenuis TaxID=2763655 RepID=A0A926D5M3_9FIRM|nr:M81 family metallopeptidase [Gehongia tenuis]MBC8531314.1 M81 family metallopeptidase [Gehongia tenuis]